MYLFGFSLELGKWGKNLALCELMVGVMRLI